MTLPDECFFCASLIDECRCNEEEMATKTALLNFFVDAMKEFAPRKAEKITLYDAVDFVNEWFDCRFSLDDRD